MNKELKSEELKMLRKVEKNISFSEKLLASRYKNIQKGQMYAYYSACLIISESFSMSNLKYGNRHYST